MAAPAVHTVPAGRVDVLPPRRRHHAHGAAGTMPHNDPAQKTNP